MPTFVHTADIHFDSPFSARLSAHQAELRRKEQMQTFGRICEAAKEKDVFFIAGDLFDGRFVSGETVAFLKRCFSQMPNTRVFLVAGNHDPFTSDSVYETEEFGENVHVFSTQMEYVDLPDLQIRVHGRSFATQREEQSLMQKMDLHPDWCNVLLLHGDVVADGGQSVYNPLEKHTLEQSGITYGALGHIHKYSGLKRLGGTYFAYPGIPEGRGFDEDGAKGFLTGILEKGEVQAEFQQVCGRQFVWLEVDVTELTDSLRLVSTIEDAIENHGGSGNLFRVILTGKAKQDLISIEVLTEQMKNTAFYLEFQDETKPAIAPEVLAKEPTLRGAFAAAMLEEIAGFSEEEKEIGELALKIGMDAMEKGAL